MTARILSISGLRGIVGNGLQADEATRFGAGLGSLYSGGRVILSRDGRQSGEMLYHAVLAGLLATGCTVLDAGIAPTPTCGILVSHFQAQGGVQLTASHNPIEWNGIKPFTSSGAVFDASWGEKLLQQLASPPAYQPWNRLGRCQQLSDPGTIHIERVLAQVDVSSIRRRRFRVVLDVNHGSGAIFGPRFLEALGCQVEVLGGTADGLFEHPPEPLHAHLTTLCDHVLRWGADVGFAQDPDADRLAVVDERGHYISEELTLALCADHLLPRRMGAFVVNGSSSRINADLAAKHGCSFYRTAVGEAHVVARMREVGAVLGGEGNGGVIDPQVGWVRDSFAAMAYILEGLAQRQKPLSVWVSGLPRYVMRKEKIECPREVVPQAAAALCAAFPDASIHEGDGMRLEWHDRWVQIRASNTEPIIRILAEAPDEEAVDTLCQQALQVVRSVIRN
ncbi:MAG: phosphoglucosamine mutase [Planctomycetaceae bacterium]|nr:MAG: phosphoglucosamine mutase [Planctomycetaceae bacterium]